MRTRTGMREEDAARVESEWETFVKGPGRLIASPTHFAGFGNADFTIYVYQRLGGHVIRYRLRCGLAGEIRIQEEVLASWIGDCRGIM